MMRSTKLTGCSLLGFSALLGCTGVLNSGGKEGGDSDGDLISEGPGGVAIQCNSDAQLADTPLLKLSTQQYKNTVRDLLVQFDLESLQDQVDPVLSTIPSDSLGEGFRSLDERVSLEHVQGFFNLGVVIGDALANDPSLIAMVAPECEAQTEMTEACWDDLQSGFLRAVYRRPLNEAEIGLFETLNQEATSGAEGVRNVVIVALSSPRFIYHVEVDGSEKDGQSDLLSLDAYEVASRLSYTFWQTMPDEELLGAAADGSLLEEDVYDAQLARIFEDERSHETLEQFWLEWLKLEKFTGFETARPGFQSLAEGTAVGQDGHDYYGDMVQEILDLTSMFTFDEPSSLSELLLTNVSVTQSEDLASLYGVEPWSGAGALPTFDPAERSGLLQRAALLVSNLEQTNPFHRGALLRRAILCDDLPQPDPNDLPPGALDPPPFDPAQTTRERFEQKIEDNALCLTCHQAFSPIGYVMESYDALGRYRTEESIFDEQNGDLIADLPIDTTGDVRIASRNEDPVADAQEMNQRIADSGKVEACLARNYFAFAARRAMQESSLDECVVQDLATVLAEEDGGLGTAFERIARVPTFFTKKVGAQ